MLSSPERPWIWLIWRALPPPLRRRVTARRSLLWLVATAALFVTCLASFLVWVGEDHSVALTPSSGHHESAPPGDWGGEQPTEEAPAEEAPGDEASAEEEPAEEAPAEEEPEPDDEAPADKAAAEESVSVSPSMLPIVVSGVSGFGGLLSGVAAMMTARQAADKSRRQQAPGCTHGRRSPEHRQLDRDDACRRG